MKGSLRKAIALIMTFMMVWSCLPVNVMAEIIEASGSIQPFAVIQPDQGVYVTFEFYNEGEKVDTQIVTNGETLYAPTSPAKDGYKFVGWKTADGAIFNGFGQVSGYETSQTVKLTAAFEEVHYVFFLNEDGAVCATKEGVAGQPISTNDVTFPTATDEGIAGWYFDEALKQPAGNSVILKNKNITLYPKVEKGHWITFNSDGGSYIAPVFVAPNATTQEPAMVPTRTGFTFLGWYNGEQKFVFGSTLEASVELTAKWQGNTVQYKVLYWLENADDDEYSLGSTKTLNGVAGKLTNATSGYNPGQGFQLSTDSDKRLVQKTIEGDGSTLVNVYYDRNVYTINFYTVVCGKEVHEHTYGCYWRGRLTCDKEEHTHTSACYKTISPIVAKYGAFIGDQWPSNDVGGNNWSTKSGGGGPWQANIQTMPLNGDDFWVPEDMGTEKNTATYYVEVLDGEDGTDYNGKRYKIHHQDTVQGDGLFVSKEDKYALVGFTYRTGTDNDENYNGAKFYYTRNDYTLTLFNGGNSTEHTVQYEADISGYGDVPARPEGTPANFEFQGWYLDESFQEPYDFTGKTMPAQNVTVYAKWAAPDVKATVYLTMAGDGEPKVYEIPYNSKIDEDELAKLGVVVPEGYTWHGWATKEGDVYTPFNFDTFIVQDVVLYPYYTSNASFTVAYDANGGSGVVTDQKSYADRSYADVQYASSLTAPAGKVFLGWNTQINGSGDMVQPGDKMLIVAEDATNNTITLYAQWGGQAGTVELTYHANFTEAATATKVETQLINNGVITVSSYEATGLSERAGYEFIGWNTAADGTGTDFAAGESVRVNDKSAAEANHLYAQWEKKVATYTVQHYIQVLDAEDKLQYELADEESFTVDVGKSVNDELINALKKSNLRDADDGIGSPAYADGLYHYVYERNEAELAVDGQITSDADVIKLYYQRELTRTVFDDGVVSAEDAYADDPNEIRQGVITVETHYVGGSKDGTVNTNKVYFKFNKSEMVDLKIAVNSDEYILNTITADLSGGNRWNGTVLDNVLGNSTVRIYLTPKYTLEYYKVENGEETRVYADVETKTYTLAPETTGTQAFVQTEYPTSATLQPLPEEEGYTWSGWYQDVGLTGDTLPENSEQKINDLVEDTTEKVIKLYTGNKTANEYPYTIHHYLYGTTVKVAEDTTGTDAFGTNVMVTPATKFLAGFEKAQAKNSIPAMITIKVDGNEATVYYTVPLTLTADGASKTYDGDPLTCGTFTADGLVNGDEVTDFALSMTAESTITNVGRQSNVIDEATVTYKGEAIPSYYTVAYEPGTLTITAVSDEVVVTITEHSATETYDGTEKSVTGYTVTNISNELYKEKDFTFSGTAEAKGTNQGFYPMEVKAEDFTNNNKNFSNVKFEIVDGGLTIAKRPVTITIENATYTYDGTEKTVVGDDGLEYTVEREAADRGLLTGDTIDLNVVYGTDDAESKILVGQYEADGQKETVTISHGNCDVTANYAVTIISGLLTITDDPVNPDGVVTKTHDGETYKLDETVTFDIEVKNIYNEAKTITITEQDGVTLKDADEAGKLVIENVAPGETVTAKATYRITEADILAGTFVNTVKVEFSEGKPFENDDDVDVEEPKAELKLEKTIVDRQVEYKLGEAIKYQIVVSNTGNVTRSDVVVTDDMFTRTGVAATILVNGVQVQPEGNQLKLGDVLPNTQITITYSYQVTSADIQVGKVTNTAIVTGDVPEGVTKPEDPTVTEEAKTEDIRVTMTVTKTSDVAEGETVGLNGKIHYTITVTNKGNVPYENVVVKDELAGAVILAGEGYTVNADNTATIANLPVNGSVTVKAEYTVTSEDILNGHVKNIATATADPIDDPKTGEEKTPEGKGEEDDKTDPIDRTLTVVKTSGSTDKVQQGETIHYTITVTNDGNVPYENVVVKDELAGAVILAGEGYTVNADNTATIANLPVNGSVTVEAEYTVTEADLANGAVVNVASATADPIPNPEGQTDPETPEGTSEPDERKVAKPDLSLEKKADLTVARPGDILTYTLTLANVGDGRAKDVVVTDALPEQVEFVRFVTANVDATVDADGLLTWNIDTIEGTADPAQPTTLTLQFQAQIAAEENLTAGDLAIANRAKIEDQPTDDPTDEDTEETVLARMDVAKTAEILNADGTVKADQSKASLGDIIHYEITVSNLGGSELPDVELTDAMILKAIDGSLKLDGQPVAADQLTAEVVNIGALAIGASKVLSYDYQVVEADILAGGVSNMATADTELPELPDKPVEDDDTIDTPTDDPMPMATVVKEVVERGPVNRWGAMRTSYMLGETINYTFTITNTGNVTLTDLVLEDLVTSTSNPTGHAEQIVLDGVSLAPGEQTEATFAYTVQGSDLMPVYAADGTTRLTNEIHNRATLKAMGANQQPGDEPTSVESNEVTVTAEHYVRVRFIDNMDGTTLKDVYVMYGGSTTPPTRSERVPHNGYDFIGWVGGVWENVTSDQIIFTAHKMRDRWYPERDEDDDLVILDANIPLAGGYISNVGDCFD